MKKKTFFQLLILVGALFCWSCSDDEEESPFQGTDNTLVSLTLTTTDGVEYAGAITGNQVVVTAPKNVSLSGASAVYELCEQATISPDPAQVSDWDSDQQFTVTSYSQSSRTYTYTVNRTDVSSEGTVQLKTQADVEELAESGVTVITGDLVIGESATEEEDPITDLSALSGLVEVKKNIFVYDSFAGTSLQGLENIRSAAGLYLGSTTSAVATVQNMEVELPSLKTLGSLVVNSNTITSLSLPALKEVGYFYLCSRYLESLNVEALTDCSTDLILKQSSTSTSTSNQTLGEINFPALTNIGGLLTLYNYNAPVVTFPLLQQVGGKVDIRYMGGWEEVSFPELKTINGAFNLQNTYPANIFSMPSLQSVNGDFSLDTSTSYNTLSSINLDALESVEGKLAINTHYKNTYESLNFPSLTRVAGQLNLAQNQPTSYLSSVQSISFPKLTDCTNIYIYGFHLITSVDVSQCTNLTDLSLVSLFDLQTLNCVPSLTNFTLNAGSRLIEQVQISGLEEVTGTMSMNNFTQNTDYTIPNIKKIGTLTIMSGAFVELHFPEVEEFTNLSLQLSALTLLDAPKLTTITGYFYLLNLRDMPSDGFNLPLLTKIGGEFRVRGYGSTSSSAILSNLDAFSGLQEIGSVNIGYSSNKLPNLVDFSGLKNALGSLSASTWSVNYCGYNPTYADMLEGKYTNQE